MLEQWSAAVSYLADCLVAGDRRQRIAISSISGDAGVSTLARELVVALTAARQRVLFLDVSQAWDETQPPPAPSSPCTFMTDPAVLEDAGRFSDCDQVVIELPPLMTTGPKPVSPWRVAATCDILLLVCLRGATDREALQSVSRQLNRAGVRSVQLVVNERDYLPLADEIAKSVAPLPLLGSSISRAVLRSVFLRSLS